MRAAAFVSIIASMSFSLSVLADSNSKNEAQELSIDQKVQIVGTIAQSSKKGAQSGVVILKDTGAQRMIFAELGKAFQIDQRSFIITRIDMQGAVIANTSERYELAYINPPSNSANTLVYESDNNDTPPEATTAAAERTAEVSTQSGSPASPASPAPAADGVLADAAVQRPKNVKDIAAEPRDVRPAVDTSEVEQPVEEGEIKFDDEMNSEEQMQYGDADLQDDGETFIEPSSDVYQFERE